MSKNTLKIFLAISILAFTLLAAGCGGGSDSGAKRITGLSPDEVIKTTFNAAKDGRINDASSYVSPTSRGDMKTVVKFITGQTLDQMKNSNLLSIKQVAKQDNYVVELVTLQTQQNSMEVTIKPIGLEKVNGEWYIVDFDQIYNDTKYKVLQQLMANI